MDHHYNEQLIYSSGWHVWWQNQLKRLCEERNKLHARVYIRQTLNKYHTQLLLEQEYFQTKILALLYKFINCKQNIYHEHENDPISAPHTFCDGWNHTKNSQ